MSDPVPVSVPSPDKRPLFGVPPSIELNVSARPGHSGTVVVAHDPRRYRLGGRNLRYRQRRHAVGERLVVEVNFETGRKSASLLWLCSFYGTQDSLSISERRLVCRDGEFVLYWMIAFRRTEWNHSLQRTVEWAVELGRPLVIFEPLRIGYRWASDRLHQFVIDGMGDNVARLAAARNRGVLYFPCIEPRPDHGKGLLAALAEHACVVVTDDFPYFFLPHMVAAAMRLPVRLEQVDSNGLLPLRATNRIFTTAFSFRAFLQKELPAYLADMPVRDPISISELPPLRFVPAEVMRQWPPAADKLLAGDPASLTTLPIDHSISVVEQQGGTAVARKRLHGFLTESLNRYADSANDRISMPVAACLRIFTWDTFRRIKSFNR